MTGALDALHGPVGVAVTSEDTGKWDRALAGPGESVAATEMTFKNHGCCGHIFVGLDAVADRLAEEGFGPDDVEAVRLGGYGPTKEVCDRPDPATEQEARFSAQYCIAAPLVLGGVRLAAFEPAALSDPAIRALSRRVTASLDPELATDGLPRPPRRQGHGPAARRAQAGPLTAHPQGRSRRASLRPRTL